MTMPASRTLMPGGGVARRPLHFIVVADCSGSMLGQRMQSLNLAVAEMLSHLAAWERDQLQAQVMVRVLAFATRPVWHVPEPVGVSELHWKPLQAIHPKAGSSEVGQTNMGPAFREVAAALGPDRLESRALRPAILLVTDGKPTDRAGEFEAGLASLMSFPAGRSSLRLAIAIGDNARSEYLDRFIGDPSIPVLLADNSDEVAERLVAVSIAVSRMSEEGADREALAKQILGPGSGQPPGAFDRETIV